MGTGMTVPSVVGPGATVIGFRPTLTLPGAAPSPFVTTSVPVPSGVMAKVPTSPLVARSGPLRPGPEVPSGLTPLRRSSSVVRRRRVRVSGCPSPSVSAKPEASSQPVPPSATTPPQR